MNADEKKAAKAVYKERKARTGVYAVRCEASGQTWVGQTPNLDTVQNRIWFELRQGTHPHRSLQEAWTEHAGQGFTFEALERLDEEGLSSAEKSLKERIAYWRSKFDAFAI